MIFTDCSKIVLAGQYGAETQIAKIYLGNDSNLLYPKQEGNDFKISMPVEGTKGDIYCLGNADGYLKSWSYSSGKRSSLTNVSYDDILKIKLSDNNVFYFSCDRNAVAWYDLDGNKIFSECFVCNRGYPHLVDDSDEDAYYEYYSNSKGDNVERMNRGGRSSDGYHLMYLYKIEKI